MTINNVSGVRTDITEMLSKMREISSKTKAFSTHASSAAVSNVGISNAAQNNGFSDALSAAKDVLTNVNSLQLQSEQVKNSYLHGDGNVSMSQVLIASQKSKLAFEGLVTVRNKILEAYKEIMNMPV